MRIAFDFASGILVFDPVPASRSAGWLLPALLAGIGVLVLTVVGWPVLAYVRRRYAAPFPFTGARARAYLWVRLGALLALASVVGWAVVIATFDGPRGMETIAANDAALMLVQVGTWIGLGGGLLTALYHLRTTLAARPGFWASLRSILLCASFGVLVYFAVLSNLFRIGTDY